MPQAPEEGQGEDGGATGRLGLDLRNFTKDKRQGICFGITIFYVPTRKHPYFDLFYPVGRVVC